MHEIEFLDNEIQSVVNALDFYSRIWIGQYDHILGDLRWYRNCRQLDALDNILRKKFTDMRNIILPELRHYGLSGSYGIFSPDRDIKAAIAYDMQQEFRYKSAWFKHPEGGITVNFGKPLPCDDDPCDFPKAECYSVNGEFRIKVCIDNMQLGIITDALNISILKHDCDIRKLFEYYTDNQEALLIAAEITELLGSVETKRLADNKLYFALAERLSGIAKKKSHDCS